MQLTATRPDSNVTDSPRSISGSTHPGDQLPILIVSQPESTVTKTSIPSSADEIHGRRDGRRRLTA